MNLRIANSQILSERGVMKTPRGPYASAGIPVMVRQALACVAIALKARGTDVEEIVSAFEAASYPVSTPTLYRWMKEIEEGSVPLSAEKATGAARALTAEQERCIAGWFLTMEDNNIDTRLEDYARVACALFGVQVSPATASRNLRYAELSYKLKGPRKRASKLTMDQIVLDYLDCVQRLHREGYLSGQLDHLWSIDATTTTQKDGQDSSWGRLGGEQRKAMLRPLKFTDNLITLVNALGQQLGPGIFTSNPELDPDGTNGPAVKKYCREHALQPRDIYYLPDGPAYVKESRDMYQSFLADNGTWEGHIVLSDMNTIFTKGGINIFEDAGFDSAPQLNAASHGESSINDGVIHGNAKARWTKMGRCPNTPQWIRTLDLAHCIITTPAVLVKQGFKDRLMLGSWPTLQKVEAIVKGKDFKDPKRNSRWKKCKAEYEAWVQEHGEPVIGELPKELQE
jgi:transposase